MGQGKFPWYTHRLMHRKRVTCELHDSYFRLMMIKHAIPKIEWAIELLYNLVKAESQWVGDQRSWRQEVVKKATTQQKGPSRPLIEFRDQTRKRQDEVEKAIIQQRAGLRLSSPGEREIHNADGHKSGGQYIAVLFSLQLPLTHILSNKVRGIFFLKKSSLVIIHCINMYYVLSIQHQTLHLIEINCLLAIFFFFFFLQSCSLFYGL